MSLTMILAAGVCVLVAARSAAHQKHPLRAVLFGAVSGLAALSAVNVLGPYTGVTVPLNPFTAFSGAVLGVPGVITLLALNLMFTLL